MRKWVVFIFMIVLLPWYKIAIPLVILYYVAKRMFPIAVARWRRWKIVQKAQQQAPPAFRQLIATQGLSWPKPVYMQILQQAAKLSPENARNIRQVNRTCRDDHIIARAWGGWFAKHHFKIATRRPRLITLYKLGTASITQGFKMCSLSPHMYGNDTFCFIPRYIPHQHPPQKKGQIYHFLSPDIAICE